MKKQICLTHLISQNNRSVLYSAVHSMAKVVAMATSKSYLQLLQSEVARLHEFPSS